MRDFRGHKRSKGADPARHHDRLLCPWAGYLQKAAQERAVLDGFAPDFIASLFRGENRVFTLPENAAGEYGSPAGRPAASRRRDHLTAANRVTGETHRRCVKVRFTSIGITGLANRKRRLSTHSRRSASVGTVGKHLFFDRVAAGTIATQDAS